MDESAFAELLEEVLDDLPTDFASHLENVAVVIETEPTPELLRSLGLNPRRDTLFGLYQGTPLSERGSTYGNALPDTISIFYRPLLQACRTPAQLRREIRKTVIHEIGHYFGMDEDEIERLGFG